MKQWINTTGGDGYWQDFTPVTRDSVIADFYKNATASLTPDAGTTPFVNSFGPGTQPVINFTSGGKQYYLTPALGKDVQGRYGQVVMGDNGIQEAPEAFSIDPGYWKNWSNDTNWGSNVSGLPVMKADWAADLVKNSPYGVFGEYSGGGWVSDKPIATSTWENPKDESWISQFMQGPAIPLGGFLGAGAFNSGGLGNFLNSFGGGGAAGAAGGAMDMGVGLKDVFGLGDVPWGVNPQSGANMFDPFADFGADYFSGAADYLGNAAAATGANPDSIELLINNLNSGLSSADAIKAVEASLPGSTQSITQFLMNNPSQIPSYLLNSMNQAGGLSKLLSSATNDNGKLLGGLLSAGLGMYGSNQQAKSLMDIANQAKADRQPFLNAALGYLGNPDSYFAGPGKSAMDATLRGLSASVGNPIGSPTAMGIATEAGLRDWRNAVTGFGNMGLAGQDLRAGLQSQAAQADANGLNALGYGLNTVLNPQPNITDIVKAMNMGGLA